MTTFYRNRLTVTQTLKVYRPETSAELVELLLKDSKGGTPYVSVQGIVGILLGVQREDGSGRSFNVNLKPVGEDVRTVYVRFAS
jgi:hypothetical protein